MIYHTVLFKWKSEATEDQINDVVRSLNALSGVIPSLLEIQVGKNFSDRSGGYTHVLITKFKTKEQLDQYMTDERHHKIVVEKINPIAEARLVGDLEV